MGRIVVISILIASGLLGFTVYKTLKNSPAIKNSVALQLENKFQTYLSSLPENEQSKLELENTNEVEIFGGDSIPVNYQYFLVLKEAWSIQLHDKSIHITAPAIHFESIISSKIAKELQQKYKASIEELAQKQRDKVFDTARATVSIFLQKWLEFQFPKEKNIELKVHFLNEPSLK